MALDDIPCEDMIRLRKNQERPHAYDVELEGAECLKSYSSLEAHLILYPYNKNISSDDVNFFPFEEYVKDISSQQRSAYTRIRNSFGNTFGLLLGVLIILIVLRFRPSNVFTVEALVSVFGAYIIGKELWGDLEKFLMDSTKKRRIRFKENYYRYQLEKHTTLAKYTQLAKRHRYGKTPQIPEKIDFIRRSNSQTLRMCFDMKDFRFVRDQAAHILTILIEPTLLQDFEKDGFMFGVKLAFNRRFLCFTRCFEFFQSIHKEGKGCLTERGDWAEGTVFFRKCLTLGRLKFYLKSGMIQDRSIVLFENYQSEQPANESDSS